MDAAILVVWSIGLVLALAGTLVVLKEVFLVVGTLRDILQLARITRDAARGLAANMDAVSDLQVLERPARALREAAGSLARTAGALDRAAARQGRAGP